jgi:ADP-heptose:LPS heptosyltransferase
MNALHKILFLFYVLFLRLRHWKRVIVLERTSGLGDVICCIPSYRALKQKHPKHLVVFATAKPYDDLLRNCGEIDAVYAMPPGFSFPQEKATWLVDRHYEPHTSDERRQGGQKLHLTQVFLKDCGLTAEDWQPHISISTRDKEAVARRFGFRPDEIIFAIHTGRTWPVRELPGDCWQQVVNRMHDQWRCRILHFCSPTGPEGKRLPAHELTRVEKITPALPLPDMAALLSSCRLFVGIDSGMLHLAGALGIPSVGIFGSVNPGFRLPLGTPTRGVSHILPCSYCHHEQPIKHWFTGCPYDIRCMKEISAGQVMEAVKDILSRA